MGTTKELLSEIASEMGVSGSGPLKGISARISSKMQTRVGFSVQEKRSEAIELSTDGQTEPKRYALWRVASELVVESLVVDDRDRPTWTASSHLEWYESETIHTTAFSAA